MSKPIRTISSRIAWACRWYRVRQDEIMLPNGQQGEYNVVELAPSVFIVPVTGDGHILLIESYRYTLDSWVWEIPAGSLNAGQTVEQAARQELREEVGGVSERWQRLGCGSTSNGTSNEIAHFLLAYDVQQGASQHEAAEVIRVHPTPWRDALAMVRNNQIGDVPSAYALLLAEPYLQLLQSAG